MLKVILIGDSIRMGYQPLVAELLAGRAEVWGPEENGGDSRNVLAFLGAWALGRAVDVIHFNCGLHDCRLFEETGFQVPVEEYARNLGKIVEMLKSETSAELIWATITPVHDARQAKSRSDFRRTQVDVERYNRAALEVVNRAGLRVNDLHGVVERAGVATCLSPDGVHMTGDASRLLAQAVADAVMK
ncbi:MAG TPA: GDSL-type esterase/lipase family protein [Planctomycetota bacterium]|nr:GDSL-type esterase/lipase family protein [Planctomycetota bacterium]